VLALGIVVKRERKKACSPGGQKKGGAVPMSLRLVRQRSWEKKKPKKKKRSCARRQANRERKELENQKHEILWGDQTRRNSQRRSRQPQKEEVLGKKEK